MGCSCATRRVQLPATDRPQSFFSQLRVVLVGAEPFGRPA